MPGKRVQFDEETWEALDLLAKDRMADFQELADEAFRDLLAKHGRPLGLKDQLKLSLRREAANDAAETASPGAPASRIPAPGRKPRTRSPAKKRAR
jgi:hypothetical protein